MYVRTGEAAVLAVTSLRSVGLRRVSFSANAMKAAKSSAILSEINIGDAVIQVIVETMWFDTTDSSKENKLN